MWINYFTLYLLYLKLNNVYHRTNPATIQLKITIALQSNWIARVAEETATPRI